MPPSNRFRGSRKPAAVCLAGISLNLAFPGRGWSFDPRANFRDFRAPAATPHFKIAIAAVPRRPLGPETPRIRLRDKILSIARTDFAGSFDLGAGRGRAETWGTPHALDSLFRVFLAEILLRRRGFLVHASSVLGADGRALVLPGPSGSGKSTILAKAAPGDALAEETTALVREREGWTAWGLPFRRTWRHPVVAAPLAGLFFLERNRRPGLHPLTAAGAAGRILPRTLFYRDDRVGARKLSSLAARLVSEIPAWRFSYRLRRSWRSLQTSLTNAAARTS
ncbi:MAG: hypothetical protein V1809_02665 [Planctomycetota bacterium]